MAYVNVEAFSTYVTLHNLHLNVILTTNHILHTSIEYYSNLNKKISHNAFDALYKINIDLASMSTALIFLPNFVHLTRSCVTMSWRNRSCCFNITLQYKHNHKEMFKGPSKSHST